ncbi:MAG: UDP-glucose/GDP-mannose dehydrogenase family protein [Candidatus Shapirobacteria bacterium]|nr:UDP-glucose/GDP-mannose dehydrogenase family protein [Candidatus Shapirobacteria bacterium]
MKICFVGIGYVGLTGAVVLASLGNQVWTIDIDQKKINQISKGQAPFYEPGLDALIKKTVASKKLIPTSTWQEPIAQSQIIFITVGTPTGNNGRADLRQIKAVAKKIADNLNRRYKVIVNKSTVPVGTAQLVKTIIQNKNSQANFDVVSCPEFLREGSAVADTKHPERIVIGTDSDKAFKLLSQLFTPLKAPIVKTSIASAEIIKYAANSYLALRIGFIDQVASLCEEVGADIKEVIKGISLDSRIGGHYWYPGVGYGGYCFPKDVAAFAATFKEAGLKDNLFSLLDQANQNRPKIYAQKIADKLSKPKTVAVLGLTAKPGTDDIRGSQAILFIKSLVNRGMRVKVYDPKGMMEAEKILQGVIFCQNQDEAITEADSLAILCEWPEFKKLDWNKIKKMMKGRLVFDAKRMFDKKKLTTLGFDYFGVGV